MTGSQETGLVQIGELYLPDFLLPCVLIPSAVTHSPLSFGPLDESAIVGRSHLSRHVGCPHSCVHSANLDFPNMQLADVSHFLPFSFKSVQTPKRYTGTS